MEDGVRGSGGDVQSLSSTKATLVSLAPGDILVPLISKAGKSDIVPERELGIVLSVQLSHFFF